jgi:hypothetical protein
MKAKARDARGQGGAQATITSTMESSDEGTRVKVETDMRVTGAAAQFGRGVMQDVSAQMMGRFADCLASEMSGGDGAQAESGDDGARSAAEETAEAGAPAAETPTAGPLPDDVPEPPGAAEKQAPASQDGERPTPEVLDLGELGRGVLAKRAAPVAGALAGVLVLLYVLRRLRR